MQLTQHHQWLCALSVIHHNAIQGCHCKHNLIGKVKGTLGRGISSPFKYNRAESDSHDRLVMAWQVSCRGGPVATGIDIDGVAILGAGGRWVQTSRDQEERTCNTFMLIL